MHTFTTNEIGRIIIIHLGKGEDILSSVQSEINRLNVRNGILVSAIGSILLDIASARAVCSYV